MGIDDWTHPKHFPLAVFSTVLCGLSFGLALCACLVTPLFFRQPTAVISQIGGGERYTLMENLVDCTDDYCKATEDTLDAGWQYAAYGLATIAVVMNSLTFLVQVLLFWPLYYFGKTRLIILRVCQGADILGGYSKFLAAFIYISHSADINDNYAWHRKPALFELRSLPLGLLLISFVMEVLCVLLHQLSLDKGARGGLTHERRLQLEKGKQELMEAELKENRVRRKSSYIPHPESTHGHVQRD